MRYLLRQKLWAFGDDFTIQDETGRDVFVVDGRAISIGDKLALRDTAGNELAFIKQKLLAWGPTYEVHRNGQLQAVVKKALFSFLRHRFTVDVEGPDDLEATGNLLDYEYTFARAGQTVATVSKRWFSFTDTYGVEVEEGQDDVLILASAVVIDLVHDDEQKRDD